MAAAHDAGFMALSFAGVGGCIWVCVSMGGSEMSDIANDSKLLMLADMIEKDDSEMSSEIPAMIGWSAKNLSGSGSAPAGIV